MLSFVVSFRLILCSEASLFVVVSRMLVVVFFWSRTVAAVARTSVSMRMTVIRLGCRTERSFSLSAFAVVDLLREFGDFEEGCDQFGVGRCQFVG